MSEEKILGLHRRSPYERCECQIEFSTILEGEHVAAGVKYKLTCVVSFVSY